MPVPWKHILTSVPLYLNISVQTGGLWSLFTLLTHAPTYFRFIHGWNNRMVSSESLTEFFLCGWAITPLLFVDLRTNEGAC